MSVCLPLHVNELKDIEAQLSSLVALYKIDTRDDNWASMSLSSFTCSGKQTDISKLPIATYQHQHHVNGCFTCKKQLNVFTNITVTNE